MVRVVDEVLIQLGIDPGKFKNGLAQAASASRSFVGELEKHQQKIAGLTILQAASFAAQAAFIKDVTGEFAAQETAVNKLNVLLKQEQRTRTDSVAILTAQADALQRITPFADEQIISMQATAAAFGMTDEQIEKLTPHLLDAAAGFRDVEGNALDLNTVALAVGKAINGNAGALQRLGIDLGLAQGESADFATVMDVLAKKFGGAAVAAGTTFAGQMKIAQQQISEVKEALGAALAPAILSITKDIVPLVTKFGEWATAHKDIVLAIVGGGLAGSGLIAAVGALGLAVAAFGAATGPIGLAILGVSALVGWLIKLKLSAEAVPTGIDALSAAIATTEEKLEGLEAQIASMPEPFGIFSLGSKKNDLREEAEKTRAELALLRAELAKTPGFVTKSDGSAAGRSRFLGNQAESTTPEGIEQAQRLAIAKTAEFGLRSTDEWLQARLSMIQAEYTAEKSEAEKSGKDVVAIEIKKLKAIADANREHMAAMAELRKSGLAPALDLSKPMTTPGGVTVPGISEGDLEPKGFTPNLDSVRSAHDELVTIHDEALTALEERDDEYSARSIEKFLNVGETAGHAVAGVIVNMGEMFAAFLETSSGVANAIGKTIVVSAIEALKTVVRAFGEAEIAKALMGGFLSFGATLAAIGPIAAAMAGALGVLSSIQSSFVKKNSKGSYEFGGVIPETGPYLMHAGEVVHNPKRNDSLDLVSNMNRAGAGKQLRAIGGTERGGGITIHAKPNFWGPVMAQVDMDNAMRAMADRLARAQGFAI